MVGARVEVEAKAPASSTTKGVVEATVADAVAGPQRYARHHSKWSQGEWALIYVEGWEMLGLEFLIIYWKIYCIKLIKLN